MIYIVIAALLLLPIGALRGPVPLLVNVAIPLSVLVLLASRSGDRPTPAGPAQRWSDPGRAA